jgi:hypothetical protein
MVIYNPIKNAGKRSRRLTAIRSIKNDIKPVIDICVIAWPDQKTLTGSVNINGQ